MINHQIKIDEHLGLEFSTPNIWTKLYVQKIKYLTENGEREFIFSDVYIRLLVCSYFLLITFYAGNLMLSLSRAKWKTLIYQHFRCTSNLKHD